MFLVQAVVAILVELSPADGVGAVGVPVNAGEASGAFALSAVCTALLIGLLASDVLSTLLKPICALVTPCGLLLLLVCEFKSDNDALLSLTALSFWGVTILLLSVPDEISAVVAIAAIPALVSVACGMLTNSSASSRYCFASAALVAAANSDDFALFSEILATCWLAAAATAEL